MKRPILITSFQPWLAHQRSNSSDDLIEAMQTMGLMPHNAVCLRHLPVSFELAPVRVENEIRRLKPQAVICCGMAEKRTQLSVERQAKWYPPHRAKIARATGTAAEQVERDTPLILQTTADVDKLVTDTLSSEVSEDAGSFVCNHLYYNVLNLVNRVNWEMTGVFIHIPVLNSQNKISLLKDFSQIVNKISAYN